MVLLMSTFSYSQVGVITINIDDNIPIDQWYVLRGEENDDVVCYHNDFKSCIELVNRILEDYHIDFVNANTDKDGSMYWFLDYGNGYGSSLNLFPDEEDGSIIIYTYEHNANNSSNK